MLQGEHSVLLTFINLPFVIKIIVLSFLSGRFRQVLLYISEKCATISSPDSGSLSYYTDGQTTIAKFGCTTGTTLKGEPVTECRNDGTWSTSTVSCGD